jgi:hypothetical protein
MSSGKEKMSLVDLADSIHNIVGDKGIYKYAYAWFWNNEKCRHQIDITEIAENVNKLDKLICDNVVKETHIDAAKAMRQFLVEEMGRHQKELVRIENEHFEFSNNNGDVRSIPVIRIEV